MGQRSSELLRFTNIVFFFPIGFFCYPIFIVILRFGVVGPLISDVIVSPSLNLCLLGGDWMFYSPGESALHLATSTRFDASTYPQHQDRWQPMHSRCIDVTDGCDTHFCRAAGTTGRIDRFYCAVPRWMWIVMHVRFLPSQCRCLGQAVLHRSCSHLVCTSAVASRLASVAGRSHTICFVMVCFLRVCFVLAACGLVSTFTLAKIQGSCQQFAVKCGQSSECHVSA